MDNTRPIFGDKNLSLTILLFAYLLIPMFLFPLLLLVLPLFALDEACTTVGGPAVNQVTVVVTSITVVYDH